MPADPSLEAFYNTLETKRCFAPTRLLWGEGCRRLAPLALEGVRRLLLVVDQGMVDHPAVGALAEHLPVVHRVEVSHEPSSAALEAALQDLPPGIDGLLCVGGGSTLDTGKALRAHLAYGTWAVKDRAAIPGMPRMVVLPTLAASGSELSRYYVVTDSASGTKRAHRAWSLAPDVALLDPVWMEGVPAPLRFLGALDAFTHLYESLLCRQEQSWLNDAICREGLAHLEALAPSLLEEAVLGTEASLRLQLAAALGGLALSNVRTGLLHDAGEALAAQVPLSHPMTLLVFLPALFDLHAPVRALRLGAGMDWPAYWAEGARRWGLDKTLRSALGEVQVDPEPLVATILADRVLMEKESPVPLGEATVRRFVAAGLAG